MATSFPKQAENSSYHEKPLQQRRRLFNQREAEETFSTVFFTQACRAQARGLAGALHPTQEISLRAGTEAGRWWKMRAGQKKEAHFPFLSRQIRGPEAAFRMSHIRNIWNTRSLLCVQLQKASTFNNFCLETNFREQSEGSEQWGDGKKAKALMSQKSCYTCALCIQKSCRYTPSNNFSSASSSSLLPSLNWIITTIIKSQHYRNLCNHRV